MTAETSSPHLALWTGLQQNLDWAPPGLEWTSCRGCWRPPVGTQWSRVALGGRSWGSWELQTCGWGSAAMAADCSYWALDTMAAEERSGRG